MSTIANTAELPAETRCLRLRRYYLIVGVVCAIGFATMGIASTVAALWNIDGSFPRPPLAALFFGTFWSGFTLLAVWMIAAYFRERLWFGKSAIVQRGIFLTRTLHSKDVLQIKWYIRPIGGSTVIRTHSSKATIYFHNFTRDEREALIRFLRETFAIEIQEGWSRFEENLRRLAAPATGKVVTRGGVIAIAVVLICFAGIFAYCWHVGLGGQYLGIGVVNAIAAIGCLWLARSMGDHELLEHRASHS